MGDKANATKISDLVGEGLARAGDEHEVLWHIQLGHQFVNHVWPELSSLLQQLERT